MFGRTVVGCVRRTMFHKTKYSFMLLAGKFANWFPIRCSTIPPRMAERTALLAGAEQLVTTNGTHIPVFTTSELRCAKGGCSNSELDVSCS